MAQPIGAERSYPSHPAFFIIKPDIIHCWVLPLLPLPLEEHVDLHVAW
jgi:hypothetical protein